MTGLSRTLVRNCLTSVGLIVVLTGCVRVDFDKALSTTNEVAAEFTEGNLQLQRSEEQKQASQLRSTELLASELNQVSAVELALQNSPAVQRMLARHWADASALAISGSIPNPVFAFSRLSSSAELEIERTLAIGLLDLISLPQRQSRARLQLEAGQIQLTADVIELVTQVRQTWVMAVVAQQVEDYSEQILESAEASVELAANMQAIGNFNMLARARQQSFYANAATGLAVARHDAVAMREKLVRLLGLDNQQAKLLKLPARLPVLPEAPLTAEQVAVTATESRLDVGIALASLKAATERQGIKLATELTDIELEAANNTVWADGERESISGYGLSIEIPIFSGVSQVRDKLNAQSLAATSALESVVRSANSHLRESYSAYRTSLDVAKHYRDEIVPLQQLVSEENVLRYNGMIIGIFELLADSRTQIESVQGSIEAASQFWLSDAALRASMLGKPTSMMIAASAASGDGEGEGH